MSGKRWKKLEGRTLDWVAAVCAMSGLLAALFLGMHIRTWQGSASDFKTLYASAWCFARGSDAYNLPNIQQVFHANGVITPAHWFGHMPVYPPFTLALLAPLTILPMVQAAYVWIVLSALLTVIAVVVLCRMSADELDLSWVWRLLVVAACVAGPLLSFGLEMGNVSVAVAALCIVTVLAPWRIPDWVSAAALAGALLLKPHIAIWVALALLLGGSGVRRHGPAIAWKAVAISSTFVAAVGVWLGSRHMLQRQVQSYRATVFSETHAGSMSPSMKESLGLPAHITSLQSTLGYWWTNLHGLFLVSLGCCLVIAVLLLYFALSIRREGATPESRLLFVGCCCGLGLIATYHRAHDAILLLIAVPWVLARLRRSWKDLPAWLTILSYAAMSSGPTFEQTQRFASQTRLPAIAWLVFYRQGALAMLLLEMVLLATLYRCIGVHLVSEVPVIDEVYSET